MFWGSGLSNEHCLFKSNVFPKVFEFDVWKSFEWVYESFWEYSLGSSLSMDLSV